MKTREESAGTKISRRDLLKLAAVGGASLAMQPLTRLASAAAATAPAKPNVLFLMTDQQGLDAMSVCGCPDVCTPNLDRLARSGVFFEQSHSANPLCSPGRSSQITSRMPSETGVFTNGLGIRSDIPNIGQWFGRENYETTWIGKWHIPRPFTANIPGFTVPPGGFNPGTVGDSAVAASCEAYLRGRDRSKPFLLVASFLEPHDICAYTSTQPPRLDSLPYPQLADRLPKLPANFAFDPKEPASVSGPRKRTAEWTELQWRYYLWSYYRMVEEVDAEIGRVLRALDESGQADNTIVVMTADHGEGRARHHKILKNYLYDEAVKVPLIFSWPGRMEHGRADKTHLVSGIDILPTLCDFAGISSPKNVCGRSLRPILEGRTTAWREFVIAHCYNDLGRMIRTRDYKYIRYREDPNEQLFDMKNDSGETKNLIDEPSLAPVLADHRKLLADWESHLNLAPKPASSPAGGKNRGKGAASGEQT